MSFQPAKYVMPFALAALAAAACAPETPTALVALAPAAREPATDRAVTPPSGTLRVCKQAGAGVAAGQTFAFTVSLAGVQRVASVVAGACVPLEMPRDGTPLSKGYDRANPGAVSRLAPAGVTLRVGDATLSGPQLQTLLDGGATVGAPSALLLNLAQQLIAAELNVLRGVQPSVAVRQAIADANAGLRITIAGGALDLSTTLAASQLGALVELLSAFNEGKTKPPAPSATAVVQIAETVTAGTQVTAIACDPAVSCANADLVAGTVSATIASGATTTVTYTNAAPPVLRVCKAAGPGIVAGTVFRVDAVLLANTSGGASYDVPAGACRDAVVAPGSYAVRETVPTGNAVASIACEPAARCQSSKPADGFVVATVVDGATTTVTYTNRSTLGTLRVCTVAGPGVAAATSFQFEAVLLSPTGGSTTLDVPAGECRERAVIEGPYLVREIIPAGVEVAAIDCTPATACQSAKPVDGIVVATVTAQSTVAVTYTNRAPTGTLQLCSTAGTGVPVGTVFSFTVLATTYTVPAGATNGSSCITIAGVPAGTVRVQQTLTPGTALAGIGSAGLPYGGFAGASLQAGWGDVTIVAGLPSGLNFTTRSTLGTLQLCETAGPGVALGTPFTFTVLGATYTVPAGATSGASCITIPNVPEGTVRVQQTPIPGMIVIGIGSSGLMYGGFAGASLADGWGDVTVHGGLPSGINFLNRVP